MVKIINIDTKTKTIRISNADGDIKTWRTTESGTHFPIREGETTKEALDKFVEKKRPESAAKGQTIGEMEKAGKDVSVLKHEMTRLHYGFYDEKGKNMTPQELLDYMKKRNAEAQDEKTASDTRVKGLLPDGIKNVQKYIDGDQAKPATERDDDWYSDESYVKRTGVTQKYIELSDERDGLKHEILMARRRGRTDEEAQLREEQKKVESAMAEEGKRIDEIKKKQTEKQQPAKDDVHSRVEKAQRVEAETGVAPEDWEAYENARESGAYNMFDYNAISEDTGLPKELIRKIQENYSTLRDAYGTPDGDDDEPAPQPKQGSQPSTADDPRKDGDDAETRAEALWDKYVPDTGPAETLFGEMLRAAGRVKYRYYNDGDMYGNGYGKETVNNAISYLGKLAGGQDTEFKKELSRAVYQATSAASRYDEEEYKRQVDRIVGAFANASWDDIKALADIKNETDSLTEYPDDTSYDDEDEEDY